MNEIFVQLQQQHPTVVIQPARVLNYGIKTTTTSHPATFNAILPAIRAASRMPLHAPDEQNPQTPHHPLQPPTTARRCWLIITTGNRAHERGVSPLAIQHLAETIASQLADSDIIAYFSELRAERATPESTADDIINQHITFHH